MSKFVTFEVGALEYEVECYGDAEEVFLKNIVRVHISPEVSDVTTLEAFVLEYAAERGISLQRAKQKICDLAHEDMLQQYADDYDDSRLTYHEGRI